jgi:hypothetical protein
MPPLDEALEARVVRDARTLCRALGYEMNTVEFAVRDGVPYAIDFLNPAPDAAVESVGAENFEWVLDHATRWLIERVAQEPDPITNYHWATFLAGGNGSPEKKPAPKARKPAAPRATPSRPRSDA